MTGSEGLLKKQIMKHCKYSPQALYPILQVIDEAKKDFHMFHPLSCQDVETLKWFKKWFGEGEDECLD